MRGTSHEVFLLISCRLKFPLPTLQVWKKQDSSAKFLRVACNMTCNRTWIQKCVVKRLSVKVNAFVRVWKVVWCWQLLHAALSCLELSKLRAGSLEVRRQPVRKTLRKTGIRCCDVCYSHSIIIYSLPDLLYKSSFRDMCWTRGWWWRKRWWWDACRHSSEISFLRHEDISRLRDHLSRDSSDKQDHPCI